MLPFRPKFAIALLLLILSLSACQANTSIPAPASDPEPVIPATPTLIMPIHPAPSQTPTSIPSPTATQNTGRDFSSLASELIEGVDWFVLIQDAHNGEILFARNSDTPFHPASMIKIPTAMAVLSIMEDQGRTLEDLKTTGINDRNFDALLEDMVVRSEESAAEALEYFARGDNQLRKKLDAWGLTNTKYNPRTSTATELITSLRLLNTGTALNQENTHYLLSLMGTYTENDQILLGKLINQLPDCAFLNKRGTMLAPTIVSDMGILTCGEQSWYLVLAGTPSIDSTATFEDIQASIEAFADAFANLVK
jgi:D-alanyl-D-alanine carboxypeptidase